MIKLADNKEPVISALSAVKGSDCMKNTIKLYLDSYGVGYGFCRFYIHTNDEYCKSSAVMLRYNNYLYCTADEFADFSELGEFIKSFSACSILADIILCRNIYELKNGEICAVMSKKGERNIDILQSNIVMTDDIKAVTDIITVGMPESKRNDFFLNTSHQHRHGMLDIYAKMSGAIPVSIASVTKNADNSVAVIPFVFTDEHFRGNGYSKQVLSFITGNEELTYQLMCEDKNIKFYEKCGFIQVDQCVKLRM